MARSVRASRILTTARYGSQSHAVSLWSLTARAAVALGDRTRAAEAHDALLPAAGELAGAASAMLTAGPVSDYLTELRRFLLLDRVVDR